jgi:hypothetical protein
MSALKEWSLQAPGVLDGGSPRTWPRSVQRRAGPWPLRPVRRLRPRRSLRPPYGILLFGEGPRACVRPSGGRPRLRRRCAAPNLTPPARRGCASDARLKRNLAPITDALATIRKLSPQTYDKQGHAGAGFVAQHVETLPELAPYVSTPEDEAPKGLNYSALFTHAVAALQQLDQVVQSQASRIAALEAKRPLFLTPSFFLSPWTAFACGRLRRLLARARGP